MGVCRHKPSHTAVCCASQSWIHQHACMHRCKHTISSLFVQRHSLLHVNSTAPAIFLALGQLVCGLWDILLRGAFKPCVAQALLACYTLTYMICVYQCSATIFFCQTTVTRFFCQTNDFIASTNIHIAADGSWMTKQAEESAENHEGPWNWSRPSLKLTRLPVRACCLMHLETYQAVDECTTMLSTRKHRYLCHNICPHSTVKTCDPCLQQ